MEETAKIAEKKSRRFKRKPKETEFPHKMKLDKRRELNQRDKDEKSDLPGKKDTEQVKKG